MSLNERAKESLPVFWKNESFKGLGVPLDGRDVLHIELHCWEVNMILEEGVKQDEHTPKLICKTKSIHNWRRQEELIVGETKFIVVLCILPYGACGMMVTKVNLRVRICYALRTGGSCASLFSDEGLGTA